MNELIAPLVRRAILDLLFDVGGQHNDDVLTMQLNAIGHRVPRRDVAATLGWLNDKGFVRSEVLGPYVIASITSDGRDVAQGFMPADGVSRHKTGE